MTCHSYTRPTATTLYLHFRFNFFSLSSFARCLVAVVADSFSGLFFARPLAYASATAQVGWYFFFSLSSADYAIYMQTHSRYIAVYTAMFALKDRTAEDGEGKKTTETTKRIEWVYIYIFTTSSTLYTPLYVTICLDLVSDIISAFRVYALNMLQLHAFTSSPRCLDPYLLYHRPSLPDTGLSAVWEWESISTSVAAAASGTRIPNYT